MFSLRRVQLDGYFVAEGGHGTPSLVEFVLVSFRCYLFALMICEWFADLKELGHSHT